MQFCKASEDIVPFTVNLFTNAILIWYAYVHNIIVLQLGKLNYFFAEREQCVLTFSVTDVDHIGITDTGCVTTWNPKSSIKA